MERRFEIGLFEFGDPSMCLYSYCCCVCSAASARTHMDDSMCLFNLCCLNVIPLRYLIRTAYKIPGNANHDVFLSSFCPCCVINQLIQTAFSRGPPSEQAGHFTNKHDWINNSNQFASNISLYCYVLFCIPKMPWACHS